MYLDETKLAGVVAAATGPLAGAWLGLHATADLMALLTAIVGATAGANLALILLDLARERTAREQLAAAARAGGGTVTPPSHRLPSAPWSGEASVDR